MVRYYGWYSSRSRGERNKASLFRPLDEPTFSAATPDMTVLIVSDYKHPVATRGAVSPQTSPGLRSGVRVNTLFQALRKQDDLLEDQFAPSYQTAR